MAGGARGCGGPAEHVVSAPYLVKVLTRWDTGSHKLLSGLLRRSGGRRPSTMRTGFREAGQLSTPETRPLVPGEASSDAWLHQPSVRWGLWRSSCGEALACGFPVWRGVCGPVVTRLGKGPSSSDLLERFSQTSLSASPVPTIQLSPAQRKTEPPQPVYSGRRGVTVTRADALGPLGGHGLAVRPPAVLQRTEVPTPPRRETLSRSVPEAVPAFGQRSRARRLEKRASSTGRMTFRANVLCVYRKLERTLPTQRRKDVSGNLELVQRACQEKNRYVVSITRFQSTSGSVIDVRHNTPILSTVG